MRDALHDRRAREKEAAADEAGEVEEDESSGIIGANPRTRKAARVAAAAHVQYSKDGPEDAHAAGAGEDGGSDDGFRRRGSGNGQVRQALRKKAAARPRIAGSGARMRVRFERDESIKLSELVELYGPDSERSCLERTMARVMIEALFPQAWLAFSLPARTCSHVMGVQLRTCVVGGE